MQLGLAIDKTSVQMLNCLLSTLEKTKFWSAIKQPIDQLRSMESSLDPFVVISIIGQHILTLNYYLESSILLECCLKIGTDSLKLKSSIYSALSVAYWKMGDNKSDLAIDAIKNDCACVIKLNDLNGQYRAVANLSNAYYQLEQYEDSLKNFKTQLDLAKLLNDKCKILITLQMIANVQQKMKQFDDAIESFQEFLKLAKQEDKNDEKLKGLKSLTFLHVQIDQIEKAINYQEQLCRLVDKVSNFNRFKTKAYLELSGLYELINDCKKSNEICLKLLKSTNDNNYQLIIYEKLAINQLKSSNFIDAKKWFEKQLNLLNSTKSTNDEKLNCLINLATVNFNLKNYQLSIDLNEESLKIINSQESNKEKKVRVLSSLGECYFILNDYTKCIEYLKEQLNMDQSIEQINKTNQVGYLNAMKKLSVCYNRTNQLDDELKMYFQILSYAKRLNNLSNQLWSYYKIGFSYYTNRAYDQAISIFQEYLNLIEDLNEDDQINLDNEIQLTNEQKNRIYHTIALIHLKSNNFIESFNYFKKDLNLIGELKNHLLDLNITNINLNNLEDLNDLMNCTKICCLLISPAKNKINQSIDDILVAFNDLQI